MTTFTVFFLHNLLICPVMTSLILFSAEKWPHVVGHSDPNCDSSTAIALVILLSDVCTRIFAFMTMDLFKPSSKHCSVHEFRFFELQRSAESLQTIHQRPRVSMPRAVVNGNDHAVLGRHIYDEYNGTPQHSLSHSSNSLLTATSLLFHK